jgi:FkbH-like protein
MLWRTLDEAEDILDETGTSMNAATSGMNSERRRIKCLVWDLDNTLWDGILLEDTHVTLADEVRQAIFELDRNGILHSIASKNDHAVAMAKLDALGLSEYFLYPQINWNSKSSSIREIAAALNIGLDTLAFIDDQEFERDEVSFNLPEVMCIDASRRSLLTQIPELRPRFVTPESGLRRQMYLSEIRRMEIEKEFVDVDQSFLATLGMRFRIKHASKDDLQRAEELTQRTNQLNTTGYTYDYDELDGFRQSEDHLLLVSSLEDRYGPYGTIGLGLVEKGADTWMLKLLLMSCRVMSRGVGTIMLSHIMMMAREAGKGFKAEFLSNDRNKMMYITFKFGGFRESARNGSLTIFEHDLNRIQPFPDYVQIQIDDCVSPTRAKV